MRCPYCTSQDLRVIDSRDVEDGVRRRRECASCGERFTTYERPQVAGLLVVKKDGRREEFSREKLLLGIRKACEKRPLAAGTLEAVVDSIETTLNEQGLAEVSSQEIGETVMGYLRQMDKIAYIRFASVYRQFEDLDTFREEVDALEGAAAGIVGDKQPPLIPREQLEVLARTPGWRAIQDKRGKARFRQKGAASAVAGGAKGSASPPARRGGPN
ncbi:MAG: transcriptional regulator NrdR [Dehalococcoidia bacterium]|jgi:transcriptional repressor NrdR